MTCHLLCWQATLAVPLPLFNPLFYIETPPSTPFYTPQSSPEGPDDYNHDNNEDLFPCPPSPALSSTPSSTAVETMSSITVFEEEIFEPQPERVQLIEGLLIDHQVLVHHIVEEI